MKKKALLLLSLIMLALSGCLPPTAPTATPSPLPTLTFTLPIPTPTPLPPTPTPHWADLEIQNAAMIPAAKGDIYQLDDSTYYLIDLTVDVESLILAGSERMLYTNNEGIALDELYLRLFLNTPAYGGTAEIERLAINGKGVEAVYELGDSAVRLPLDKPLAPSDSVEIAVDFRVKVPEGTEHGYGQFCYAEEVMALPNFYPLMPVYDDEGWNVDLAPDYGDAVYSDTALYRVSITAPKEMVVVTSGSMVKKVDNRDGTVTWTCVSGPMRDFNIVISDGYEAVSTTVGGTTVNSYYLSQDEAGGQAALRYASDALRVYNDRFGLYPFAELDVMETPTTAGGIEYPGLIVVSSGFYDESGGFFEIATAHEVAHQWWYSMVGSDQVDEPWLDESLTNYSAFVYFEDVHGAEAAAEVFDRYFESPYRRALEEGRDAPVAQPVAAFSPGEYASIVYGKGPLFFHALRQEVGDETYFNILQEYLRRHKYGIATPESFLAMAEEISGRDIYELYRRWILSAEGEK